ncbi:PIG-L family deacetylase [bacterium]|nr:PIG-L family deacetylase [bacterium]
MSDHGHFRKTLLGGALAGAGFSAFQPGIAEASRSDIGEIIVEKDTPGQPHKGKVFAALHAHLDDIPYYCSGTVAKLISEGYTGYIIRTSNDEKCGGGTTARNIKSNEEEHFKMAKGLGITDVYDMYYRNHRMNNISTQEFRSRLVFLFRFLKVDTIITFNPWGHGEENPDHWVTGRVAEEASWMSAMGNDYPEHMEAGLQPHLVSERYYFVGRPGQPHNRVVDISAHIEKKIASLVECRSQGGGNSGSLLRAQLAKQGKRLPVFGNDDATADREYVRHFMLDDDRKLGKQYGVEYAEGFYYIDLRSPEGKSAVDKYIEKNAVPL